MSTFQSRVEDYTGTISDTTALSDWLTSGARWFVDLLPERKVIDYTANLADSGSGVSVTGYRFYRAHKSGYGARLIDAGMKAQAVASDSIYRATATDPVAYIENGVLYIKPSGGTGIAMAYPTVVYSDSTIAGFPAELLQGVVLYAAIQRAIQMYNSVITSLGSLAFTDQSAPATPSAPSFTYTDASLGTYTAEQISFTDTAPPSYTNAILGTYTAEQISTLPGPPSYTKPTTTFDLTTAGTIINTDEDVELGRAEVERQSQLLQQYQQDIQNEQNEFNKELQFFNAEMQETIENVRLAQEATMKLAQDTTNLNLQNAVNTFNKNVTAYNASLQIAIKNGEFSQEAAMFEAKDTTALDIQNKAKDLEKQISQYAATLQKYQADVQSYGITVNKNISEYNANIQKYVQQMTSTQNLTAQLKTELKEFMVVLQ